MEQDVHTAGDDLVIRRDLDLDLAPDDVWELLGTEAGWRRWLVDSGSVDLRDGGSGAVRDGGVDRVVRVDHVEEHRGIQFTWWDVDDPGTSSAVSIDIVPRPDGGHTLAIVERISSRSIGPIRAMARGAQVWRSWEVRACVAWLATRVAAQV